MSDEIEKLKMHSPDLTQDNIAKIRALFPGCVTEAAGEDGKLRLAVDFDQLRQELSDSIVEGPQERYHLNWPGKREALITANAPIAKTLRPARDESVADILSAHWREFGRNYYSRHDYEAVDAGRAGEMMAALRDRQFITISR